MLAERASLSPSVREAFALCRRMATSHYENFTVVSWLLPARLRPHMFAIYAYCRGVDDLGDEAESDRLSLLDAWGEELERCYYGTPKQLPFIALQETIRTFDIPPDPFRRLIEANRRDQITTRYRTYVDLLDYCAHSANPVGHLVLYLFGYRDRERQQLSDATCTALQLANFWQDVSRDLDKGRIYVPLEDMERSGYSESELLERRFSPAFRSLLALEVERTRELFGRGLGLIPLVAGRLRFDLRLFSLGGLAILKETERTGYDVLHRRPSLSRWRKAGLMLRGLLPLAGEREASR